MSHDPNLGTESGRGRGFKSVLIEAVLVALAGLAVSFAANQVSSRGLDLRIDYFPGPEPGPVVTTPGTNPPSAHEQFVAQIKAKGLQVVDREQALKLFRDPRFEQGVVVFLDARDEDHFKAGHVPGAYECDRFRPEKHFPTVFPVCQMAEEIVVYCNGGDCDDSQYAAIALRDAGVANEKFFIFAGGMMNWITNGLPVEIGGRNSGNITNAVAGANK